MLADLYPTTLPARETKNARLTGNEESTSVLEDWTVLHQSRESPSRLHVVVSATIIER